MNNIYIKKEDIWEPFNEVLDNKIDFIVSNRIAEIGQEVFFYNETWPKTDYYIWKFGDGVESELEHTSHIYTKEGFYNITLMISNDFGSKFIVKKNYIEIIKPEPEPISPTQSTPD
jgi:PKD repeat protein